jgi:hypothetical protein
MTECKVCAGPHDPLVHGATERVHGWLRARVRRVLEPVAIPPQRLKPYPPGMAAVTELRSPASRKKAASK